MKLVSMLGASDRRSMALPPLRKTFSRLKALFYNRFQLLRLSCESFIARKTDPKRIQMISTACWSFPIYSQTFVYEELKQLTQAGFFLRFVYTKQNSGDQLPPRFDPVWKAKRRMLLHPYVCKRDFAYYKRRKPEKIRQLLEYLSAATRQTIEEIEKEKHFLNAFSFVRFAEACRADYIHTYFFYEGTLFGLFASFLLDIPRGISCYSDHMLNDYSLKAVPLHLQQAHIIVATSEGIRNELQQLTPGMDTNRTLVKPNAIDCANFPVIISQEPQKGEPYRVLCVSRIEPKKGLHILIDAVKKIIESGTKIELHLIGAPDETPQSRAYSEQLRSQVARLNLISFVHFADFQPQAKLIRSLQSSHLFVAPFIQTATGDKDGIPTALLEAMASGLPVIATDAGSIPEVIEDGRSGILVPQGDSNSLATRMTELLLEPEKRRALGTEGAKRVRSHFDVNRCEPRFHDRIKKVVEIGNRVFPLRGKPLVSAIIIFFNAERYLREAIESIIQQSFQQWELLLVDDGSSDLSTYIAREYAERCPSRIRYLEHENHQNRGMSATRNLGIGYARGEFLAFLDADDVWLPDKLERQVAILQKEPDAAMVYGATQYWKSWNGGSDTEDYTPALGLEPNRLYHPPELLGLLYPLAQGSAPCPSDIMVRKEAVSQVGGFEDHYRENLQIYEDQAFLVKMYLHHGVFVSDETWDRYRIHDDSCLSRVMKAGHYPTVRRYFLDWFDHYLTESGNKNGMVGPLVEKAKAELESKEAVREKTQIRHPVEWGGLRRLEPISICWGYDRGRPIDRYYIEKFLESHSADVRGRTLEIGDDEYSTKYGDGKTAIRDVLNVREGNPKATIVADLASANHIPADTFNCIILTQTLQLIYDTSAALAALHRVLKPQGVLLATFPGISRIAENEWPNSWYWNFTTASARQLFAQVFGPESIQINAFGNVLVATSFLQGLAVEDLSPEELDYHDANYEFLITVRARKIAPLV